MDPIHAQMAENSGMSPDTIANHSINKSKSDQVDVFDVIRKELNINSRKHDTVSAVGLGPFFAVLPAAGYTLQSGYTGVVSVSTSFYTDKNKRKTSAIQSNFNYSEYHQFWINTNSLIYYEKPRLNLVGDWRVQRFPTNTFGLGSHSPVSDVTAIDYYYLKFHQVVLKEILPDFFFGIGYHYDHYTDITISPPEQGVLTDYQRYGFSSTTTSSGVSIDFIYDSRTSMINPLFGTYISFLYRNNYTFLGSDNNWQSIVLDIRKYIPLSGNSNNVLAFWFYNNIILTGNPPYLELPFTAGDAYSNTERGYVQGRFRGKKYIDFESEYRFGIMDNGLLGGVAFANLASFADWPSNQFTGILPGGGIGLRLKVNKHSNTNVAIDYAFGVNGSSGFFFNVGEVF